MKALKVIILFICFLLFTNICCAIDNYRLNDQLYDAVKLKGNDIIINFDLINKCFKNGADPNWIKQTTNENGKKNYSSILSNYILCLGFHVDKNPRIRIDGTKALQILFQNGAKVSRYDGAILYFPIVYGWDEAVEMLLKNGD